MLRSNFRARRVAQAAGVAVTAAVIELMESRRLLSSILQHAGGRLEISGSDADNQIHVTRSGKSINVEIDGVVTPFPAKKIDRLLIHALGGNDTIINDTDLPAKLEGGAGDDRLVGGSDRDRFIGGDGNDTADYSARTEPVTLTLDGRRNDGRKKEHDKLDDDIEILIGGAGSDRLVGNDANNTLLGNAGVDTIVAGRGDDFMDGGEGNDLYDYSARTEPIAGLFITLAERDYITLGTETDRIGDDVEYRFLGGSGNDDLTAITNQYGHPPASFDIDGGGGNDKLEATGFEEINNVTLRGGDGDDKLHSGPDSSSCTTMFGDAGNDLGERWGFDPFVGGDGDDTLSYVDAWYEQDVDLRTMDGVENLILRGGGAGNLYGTDGPNRIELLPGTSARGIFGLGGNDTLIGGCSADAIDGGEGNDSIAGNGGNDSLIGGEGDDYLDGSEGDDCITGGTGKDLLIGGPGDDVFFNLDPSPTLPSWPDTVDGGDGNDTAQNDPADLLTSIETVI
jgi:Ca2+-binding RTX toxin-like protein